MNDVSQSHLEHLHLPVCKQFGHSKYQKGGISTLSVGAVSHSDPPAPFLLCPFSKHIDGDGENMHLKASKKDFTNQYVM